MKSKNPSLDLEFDDMFDVEACKPTGECSDLINTLGISDIFVNCTVWQRFTPEQMEIYIDAIYKYYRKHGFPYYSLTQQQRLFEFDKLKGFKGEVLVDKVIRQTMHGLGLAWHYFPHSWDVQCGSCKTPMQAFVEDDTFKAVIRKRLKTGTYVSDSGIRKMLKMFTGVQGVSNFRPTAARAIYDHYAGDGVVWDMSCGYGGRLLGAIASNRVHVYLGTDPCIPTYNGLVAIKNEFGKQKDIRIFNQCSETTVFAKESVDLCFTSPPYFNCEKYADEDTQSYIKYQTKLSWMNNFIGATLDSCYHCLKKTGLLIVNINNVKTYTTLVADFLEIARIKRFELVETLQYSLSSIHKTGFKYEPTFVFKKSSS